MIKPYTAVGLIPTVRGIRKREDIKINLEHLSPPREGGLVAVEPRSPGAAHRASRRARCRPSTTRCSTSTT